MRAQDPLSAEAHLYREYLKVVEDYAWFRTYYPGDAYANETFEKLEEARKHWDSTLIVEPIGEPAASGQRDGFTYVRVTYRHRDDLHADDTSIKQRVLTAIKARKRELAFAAALHTVIVGEQGFEVSKEHDEILWACLTASAAQYMKAAIEAIRAVTADENYADD